MESSGGAVGTERKRGVYNVIDYSATQSTEFSLRSTGYRDTGVARCRRDAIKQHAKAVGSGFNNSGTGRCTCWILGLQAGDTFVEYSRVII